MIEKLVDNEITDSIKNALKARLSSPLYGTFIISWIIFHWKFIYTLLFVSEEKIWQATSLLKNDYLSKVFFNFSNWYFYVAWTMPFILTWLVIWKFPKWISLPAFKKEEEYRLAKKRIRISEQMKLGLEEIKLEQENIKKLNVVSQKTKKEKEIEKLDPSITWKEEYTIFKSKPFYSDFKYVVESIYQHQGNIIWYDNVQSYRVPQTILAYAHTNNLIEFSNDKESISLTAKGKFFVKEFSLEDSNSITNRF